MAVGYRGGLITGKIGGDVGYMVKNAKGRTSQGWRAYQAHVSNPNNNAQRFNRVILSTMAKAYSVLRPICDHSFEGVNGASRNQKEFARYNIPMLQDQARNGLGSFNPRNVFAALPNLYIMSKGSLPRLGYHHGKDSAEVLFPTPTVRLIPSIGDFFDAMGWVDGGQITICSLILDHAGGEAVRFTYSRMVFKLGAPFYGSTSAADVLTRNTPLYKSSGTAPTILYDFAYNLTESTNINDLKITPLEGDGGRLSGIKFANIVEDGSAYVMGGFAAINSTLEGNTWKRSTQQMQTIDDSGISIEEAMDSYTTIQNSSLYLNHG